MYLWKVSKEASNICYLWGGGSGGWDEKTSFFTVLCLYCFNFFAICTHSLFRKEFFLTRNNAQSYRQANYHKFISHSYSCNMHLNLQASWPPRLIGCKLRTSAISFHRDRCRHCSCDFSQMFAFQHLQNWVSLPIWKSQISHTKSR